MFGIRLITDWMPSSSVCSAWRPSSKPVPQTMPRFSVWPIEDSPLRHLGAGGLAGLPPSFWRGRLELGSLEHQPIIRRRRCWPWRYALPFLARLPAASAAHSERGCRWRGRGTPLRNSGWSSEDAAHGALQRLAGEADLSLAALRPPALPLTERLLVARDEVADADGLDGLAEPSLGRTAASRPSAACR